MKSILIMAFVAVAGTAGPALAQNSSHLSAAFEACIGRAGTNTVQRNLCAQREAGAQDDRLNKAYQRVMRQLATKPKAKLALRDQERRWIAERDYTCKVNGDTTDSGCVVMKTAARADELESRIRF
ncbi:MAG: lysozyme inhibitor LprI family protein [Sphingomonas sp.]